MDIHDFLCKKWQVINNIHIYIYVCVCSLGNLWKLWKFVELDGNYLKILQFM